MAELTLEQVSKRFDVVATNVVATNAVTAVSELSLGVGDGEFVVLLGPTGAGKTTTLRLVAGLEQPDQGRLYLDGHDITQQPTAARDMAFVFQQYSLYPHYSVYDNLAFPLRSPLRRQSEAAVRQRVSDVAALLHIEDKLNNRATALSGGEMQRVAIGRALVRSPKLFLMDEPLSSLDAKLRDELRIELKRIQIDLGATVLYVTHDQTEAMTLADRIGVLANGKLIQLGNPEQVYAKPNSVQVAQRLGSPPINLLPIDTMTSTVTVPDAAAQIGLRPEDIRISPDPADTNRTGGQALTLAARIVQVEHLGAETIIVADTEPGAVQPQRLHILSEPGTAVHPGNRVTLYASPAAALFFNANGERLPHHD